MGVTLFPEWEHPFYSPSRLILVMAGEGAGKSFHAGAFAAAHTVCDVELETKLYWVVGKDFEQARKDFEYWVQFEEVLQNVKSLNMPFSRDQQCVMELKTGQTVVTISAYDPQKLGREEPDGIVGAEVGLWDGEAYLRCEGRLARKPHSWGFFTGSFETNQGWLPDLYKLGQGPNGRGIRSYGFPSWVNRVKYPLGENDPAIQALREGNSPARFKQRYGGELTSPTNVIFSEFSHALHVDYGLIPDLGLPVHIAVDPGDKVYCVLFVQVQPNGEVWVLDEIYESHWTHQMVVSTCRTNYLWPLVKGGTIDVAAKQAHMGMPVPLQEWWKDTGLSLSSRHIAVEDSIERIRLALSINPRTGRPYLRIHPRCKGLIAELGGGPSPVDNGGPWVYHQFRDQIGPPESGKNDHACKALAYLLAGPYGAFSSTLKNSNGPVSYLGATRQPQSYIQRSR